MNWSGGGWKLEIRNLISYSAAAIQVSSKLLSRDFLLSGFLPGAIALLIATVLATCALAAVLAGVPRKAGR